MERSSAPHKVTQNHQLSPRLPIRQKHLKWGGGSGGVDVDGGGWHSGAQAVLWGGKGVEGAPQSSFANWGASCPKVGCVCCQLSAGPDDRPGRALCRDFSRRLWAAWPLPLCLQWLLPPAGSLGSSEWPLRALPGMPGSHHSKYWHVGKRCKCPKPPHRDAIQTARLK